jgi:hypothetical protein
MQKPFATEITEHTEKLVVSSHFLGSSTRFEIPTVFSVVSVSSVANKFFKRFE